MSDSAAQERLQRDQQMIEQAQSQGLGATLLAYTKLSGPGWLQSAITLGGGSLAGALFLGILGGTNLLWLQLVAIIMGVIMLSAISYVALSTGERPFQSINRHINPVLGWSWILASMMANMIWCLPQFSLCYAALQKNLLGPERLSDDSSVQLKVSACLLLAAGIAVFLNSRQGLAAKVFDWFLKGLIGIVVICFVGVVVLLSTNGALEWGAILSGFIPKLSQWNEPTGEIAALISSLPQNYQGFWTEKVVTAQREVMIGAAATAVGINMTFLMPYSLLKRGWNRSFRGLARFDLSTGMAIPYILVTSCVVIAAATQFHGKVDDQFLSSDPAVMQTSPMFGGASGVLAARLSLDEEIGEKDPGLAAAAAQLSEAEKRIASSLVKRDAFALSTALAPLLGEERARLAFGLGIFGMGFSTIIILMLINGFALCELTNKPLGGGIHVIGCLIAGGFGAMWPFLWSGDSKVYLAIVTSSFGMMLLPIAYLTFFFMMNSRAILGDDKPTGGRMLLWNVLMGVSVVGACAAAASAIVAKSADPKVGFVVPPMAGLLAVLVVIGFFFKSGNRSGNEAASEA